MNHPDANELFRLADRLQKRGLAYEEISLELKQKGADDSLLSEVIEKAKSLRFRRRRKSGFACCGIGVTLLVAGCIVALFLYNSGYDIRFAMYGLTVLGLVLLFKGMVDLLGW